MKSEKAVVVFIHDNYVYICITYVCGAFTLLFLYCRCTSEYDIYDSQSTDYDGCTLQKDLSSTSSSSPDSFRECAFGAVDENWLLGSDGSDILSLPPESLDGSLADNLCPSPLDFLGDIDDWTPPHDPNVIHR